MRLPGQSPIVVWVLLGLTILIFLLQLAGPAIWGFDLLAGLGMKSTARILQGELWRLFTPMFLHASILHIGFNMYALFIFGPSLERHYGHWRFLMLYILAGFAGNVMSFLFSPGNSLGSSTAVFGLLGAEGMFLYQNRRIFGSMAQRALGNIVTIALINLFIGLSIPAIDNWGHIGGLLGGILFAWSAGPVLRVEGIYPQISVVDDRSTSDVLRGAFSVAALFAALAAVTIFLKTR